MRWSIEWWGPFPGAAPHSHDRTVLYEVSHPVVAWLAGRYCSLEVVGREKIPADGGVIVAANHVSYLDIPILGCSLARRADFLAKAELFSHPVVGWFLRRLGGVPIRRGGIDRRALDEVQSRLARGRVVVVYPEGTRSPDERLGPAKPGIGLLAARSGVPVVPAYLMGTGAAWPEGAKWLRRSPVTVWFGDPLRWDAVRAGHEEGDLAARRYQRISDEIMGRIAALQRQARARPVRQ